MNRTRQPGESHGKAFVVGLQLALQDITDRYRRSTFGPFWITFTQLAFVFAVGALYSQILGQSFRPYIHFLACGVLLWQFFSGIVADSAASLLESREFLMNTKLTAFEILVRVFFRQAITFAHSLPVLIVTGLIARPIAALDVPMGVVGLLLLAANAAGVGAILALVSVRFRDVPLMLPPILQFLFIVSPIIWERTSATAANPLVSYNIVGMWIDAARGPLVGSAASQWRYLAVSAFTAIVLGLAAVCAYRRFGRRITYWL